MTISIHLHQSSYRDFKAYYQKHVMINLRSEFPNLVSYPRFVILRTETILPLCGYLYSLFGAGSGVSFVDSTPLAVCHNRRTRNTAYLKAWPPEARLPWVGFWAANYISSSRTQGELLACQLTPRNVDDRTPVPLLSQRLFGKLFGDRGYISRKLFEQLWQDFHLQLIAKLRKRALIETINDQLKNISQIEHSRHRSPINFVVNVLAGLMAISPRNLPYSLSMRSIPSSLIHN